MVVYQTITYIADYLLLTYVRTYVRTIRICYVRILKEVCGVWKSVTYVRSRQNARLYAVYLQNAHLNQKFFFGLLKIQKFSLELYSAIVRIIRTHYWVEERSKTIRRRRNTHTREKKRGFQIKKYVCMRILRSVYPVRKMKQHEDSYVRTYVRDVRI